MVFVGRITKDAVVNRLKDERQVVNFSVAINDYYRPKGGGEGTRFAAFINCSYWISSKIVERLRKGTVAEVNGRIFVTSYTDADGHAKASLNCHANSIKLHSYSKEVDATGILSKISTDDKTNDLPF